MFTTLSHASLCAESPETVPRVTMSGSQKQFRCLTTGPTFARSDDLGEQYDFSKAKERTPPTPTRHFERSRPTFSSAFAPAHSSPSRAFCGMNASACAERPLHHHARILCVMKSLFSWVTAIGIHFSLRKGLPDQKLIDLYLLACAKNRKKLTMKWVA